jgi:suppressor for copper-sensitivity B
MRRLSTAIAIIMLLVGVGLSPRLVSAVSAAGGGPEAASQAATSQAATSQAATGVWVGDKAIAEVRLVSAVTATGSLRELPLGLEFRMAPGWKIYWRTPGEAGIAPSIDMTLVDETPLSTHLGWPVPQRFDAFGFDNYGYSQHVILPLTTGGFARGQAVQLRGRVEALVCKDICVPLAEEVALNLPDGAAMPSLLAQDMARYAAQVPRLGAASTIRIEQVVQDKTDLVVTFGSGTPVVDDIFVEGVDGIGFKKPAYHDNVATINMTGPVADLGGRAVDLTVVAGLSFSTIKTYIATDAANTGHRITPARDNGTSIWLIAGLAFVGGLILNLMPCVLPVLAIKLASIVEASGATRTTVRWRFLSGAAGIVVSFLLLAAGLTVVRFAGGTVGWGIQFQSPLFLAGMMLVVGLFMLMLLDRLIVPVPAFVERLSGGSATRTDRPVGGDFMAGMLATLLATPCSAPFVGSAVSAALTGSITGLFVIFLAMGLGLAAPWVVVAMVPGLVTRLPRPGPWMVWLKRCLAALLLATIVWLGFLLYAAIGGAAGLIPVGMIGIMLILLWRYGVGATESHLYGAGLGAAGALFVLLALMPAAPATVSATAASRWQLWTPDAAAAAVSLGKLVLVDVTADWCITCKANKALVLDQPPLSGRLSQLQQQGDLILLQADWTRPNAAISAFLASHDRFGIPFNIIYGPAAPDGIVLGELLTAKTVLGGLDAAGLGQ